MAKNVFYFNVNVTLNVWMWCKAELSALLL